MNFIIHYTNEQNKIRKKTAYKMKLYKKIRNLTSRKMWHSSDIFLSFFFIWQFYVSRSTDPLGPLAFHSDVTFFSGGERIWREVFFLSFSIFQCFHRKPDYLQSEYYVRSFAIKNAIEGNSLITAFIVLRVLVLIQ